MRMVGKASPRIYAIFHHSVPAGSMQNKKLGEEFSLEVNTCLFESGLGEQSANTNGSK